jgi:hypothetical protein
MGAAVGAGDGVGVGSGGALGEAVAVGARIDVGVEEVRADGGSVGGAATPVHPARTSEITTIATVLRAKLPSGR